MSQQATSALSTSGVSLISIADPNWSPWEDYYLLKSYQQGKPIEIIAGELGHCRTASLTRYRRLCVVDDVEAAIEAYGLSEPCYWADGLGFSAQTSSSAEKPSFHIGRPNP